jgi:Cellobiose phosphorylase
MNNFGSGNFGYWISGEHGLPAYVYTSAQERDDRARTFTNPAWKGRREHTFTFGNDRITATASNYGYIQIRQDEGGPKYLTDYDPKHGQYGAGIGRLSKEGEDILATLDDGSGNLYREYGAGYFKKRAEKGGLTVEELLFAPFGDDPVVLKKITVKNGGAAADFKWAEYASARFYQFDFAQFIMAQANAARLRRSFAKSFDTVFDFSEEGLSLKWKKTSRGFVSRVADALGNKILGSATKRFYDVGGASVADNEPPEVLLMPLKEKASGYSTSTDGKHPALVLFKDFSLAQGERADFYYAYIYFPKDFSREELINKYKNADFDKLFEESCDRRREGGITAKIKGKEWISRELVWHEAYLRGSMSYNSFFGEHILSQGGHYQYIMGLQGAPRDQLQHALPFIYSEPRIARETILFTLKEMSPEGELPYAQAGNGILVALVMIPSDLQFMLLAVASEYILANRDAEFLKTVYTVRRGGKDIKYTVAEGLALAYKYSVENVGTGPHGLVRIKTGDWNDQAVYGRVPVSQIRKAHKIGESVLNSALAVYAYKTYSEALLFAGDKEAAAEVLKRSEEIKKAVSGAWNGKWLYRAWMGEKVGRLGDDVLWLEPQPWAIIGDCIDKEKRDILIKNIEEKLCSENPCGAALMSRSENKSEASAGLDVGVLENGGVWPAVNGYLVWALAKADGELAYKEWLKNSLAYRAEAYPDIWYDIWSGPDSINSSYAKYPGRTQNSRNPLTGKREKFFKLTVGVDWEDFPVLNLHAHTWGQYALMKLLGLEFSARGFKLKPVIPEEEYEVKSKLFSLSYKNGEFLIEYDPIEGEGVEFEVETEKPAKVFIKGKQYK